MSEFIEETGEAIGAATLLGFVACPTCKQDCAVFVHKGHSFYQNHRIKSRTIKGSDTRICPRSGRQASAIDVLALLAGRTTEGE